MNVDLHFFWQNSIVEFEIWSMPKDSIDFEPDWLRKGLALRSAQRWSSMSPVSRSSMASYSRLGFKSEIYPDKKVFWSLSGTQNYSALALSKDVSIGLDIELRERRILDLDWGLTEREKDCLSSVKNFDLKHFLYLLFWIQKEAYFKSLNSTYEFNPDLIESPFLPNAELLEKWYSNDFFYEQDSQLLLGSGPVIGCVTLRADKML